MPQHNQYKLTIPYPPTINRYYRTYQGRILISEEGRKYRKKIYSTWLINGIVRFHTALLKVQLDIFPPDKRKRDIDNICKAVLDSLQHASLFDDDNQICKLILTRRSQVSHGQIIVTIEHWSEDD